MNMSMFCWQYTTSPRILSNKHFYSSGIISTRLPVTVFHRFLSFQEANDRVAAEGVRVASDARCQSSSEHEIDTSVTAVDPSESDDRINPCSENKDGAREKRDTVKRGVIYNCYGCGAPLQTDDAEIPGYLDQATFEVKKKHHQLRSVLCKRCKLLCQGQMITAVGGHGGYSGSSQFVTAEELREKLSHLRRQKALIVKLVDIVDFNGSFLTRVRDLVGGNPIIFVVTKIDLLPRGTDLNCVGDWVVEAIRRKKLNCGADTGVAVETLLVGCFWYCCGGEFCVISVHLTSSKLSFGIGGVISEIHREKKGRNVYILGVANVGKSAFISAMLHNMATRSLAATLALKCQPTQSAVPGTTLGPIRIKAFHGGEKLYDTPGIHLHHRQTAVIPSRDLPALVPKGRIIGQICTIHLDEGGHGASCGLNGFSIFWGGLVRVDILNVLRQTCLTFYGPNKLKIHMVPTVQADEFYQKEVGSLLTPPSGKDETNEWRGLGAPRQLHIDFNDKNRPACDIAISGLGWIAVEPVKLDPRSDAESIAPDAVPGKLEIAVHVSRQVEIFVIPPMPVGESASRWYTVQKPSEKEQQTQPRLFIG